MNKSFKAYLTLEASFVVPIITIVFYLIVIGGILLFTRCIDSQKLFVKSLYEARITANIYDTREVIYGDMEYGEMLLEGGVHRINPLSRISEERYGD